MTVEALKKMFPNLTEEQIQESLKLAEYCDEVNPIVETGPDIHVSEEGTYVEERVNHPSHYTWLQEKCGIEVIDITRHLDFCIGNAVKYLLRAGHKSEEGYSDIAKTIEDLKKAVWYINDKINSLEKGVES